MERTNKNKSRKISDFLRYRSDDMSGEERNSFEKDLQKDTFAQEASEGFYLISAEEAEKDLSDLKKKLNKRIVKSTPNIYYRLAAAASLAVLVTISVVIYNSQFNKKEMTLGKNDIEETKTPLIITATEPLRDKTEKSEPGITSPSLPLSPSPSLSPVTVPSVAEVKETESEDKLRDADELLTDMVIPGDSEGIDNNLIAVSSIAENDEIPAEEKMKSESARASEIVMQTQTHSHIAAKRKSALSFIPPQPVTGLDSFNLWIEKNIRNPRPDNEDVEEVIVSLKVMADSTVIEIHIISSPGVDYSIEAERLIREGPAWKPAIENGKPAEAETTMKIVFR